jgi:hypothetical protein
MSLRDFLPQRRPRCGRIAQFEIVELKPNNHFPLMALPLRTSEVGLFQKPVGEKDGSE